MCLCGCVCVVCLVKLPRKGGCPFKRGVWTDCDPNNIFAHNLRQPFVAMNMMNKCAKFHKDSPSGKKVKFNLPSGIELSETGVLCTTLYRNPMQASNFGGAFDQLFLGIFLCNFHRRCLSTPSIPWCKKVKNDQKLKSRGGPALKGQCHDIQ